MQDLETVVGYGTHRSVTLGTDMHRRARVAVWVGLILAGLVVVDGRAAAQHRGLRQISPSTIGSLRDWDRRIDRMVRNRQLVSRQVREDTLIPGRVHERFTQYYRGIPVFGGDLARQLDRGQTISIFGTLFDGIALEPMPTLSVDDAVGVIQNLTGVTLPSSRLPSLTILPSQVGDGGYRLTYRAKVMTGEDLRVYFIDAQSGAVFFAYSERETIVGIGRGVLNDEKKISVDESTTPPTARDRLRPPDILTFDMQGNLSRTTSFLNGITALGVSDLATDTDNEWEDGPVVDAHVYAGWTHDYLFKRFGRRGLDDANIPIVSLVHPVRREDVFSHSLSIIGLYFLNAFYAGDGVMVYGVGLPPTLTAGGQRWNYLSGALDVVAHELTHGVTDFSSDLIYLNESGALNEAFSDMVAAGVEFMFQQEGTGLLTADYLVGEDVITPGGIRSMADPQAYGDPDHYSNRFLGTSDNGGVHTNSGIANHAFYLAIEGGTNRTSGIAVSGVGSTNREQIEKIFYRAFAQLLPSNATFALARTACIQAAQELYGAGSAAEAAVTSAWSAVGVD